MYAILYSATPTLVRLLQGFVMWNGGGPYPPPDQLRSFLAESDPAEDEADTP